MVSTTDMAADEKIIEPEVRVTDRLQVLTILSAHPDVGQLWEDRVGGKSDVGQLWGDRVGGKSRHISAQKLTHSDLYRGRRGIGFLDGRHSYHCPHIGFNVTFRDFYIGKIFYFALWTEMKNL